MRGGEDLGSADQLAHLHGVLLPPRLPGQEDGGQVQEEGVWGLHIHLPHGPPCGQPPDGQGLQVGDYRRDLKH